MKNDFNQKSCEQAIIQKNILKKFVERKKKGKKNIIVIDLDGCIFNNLPRQEKIIVDRLQSKYNLPDIPKHAKRFYKKYYNLLEAIDIKIEDRGDLKEDFLSHFLDNSYLHHDTLIKGANIFISELISRGFIVHILTGRHHKKISDSMKEGTIKSLRMHGIYVDNKKIKLIMKRDKNIKDLDFKIQHLKERSQDINNNYIAVIDNETKMLEEASKVLTTTILIRFRGAQSQNIDFNGINIDGWYDLI